MEPLVARVAAALLDGQVPTADLAALLLEAGGERCRRRERITYLLNRFLTKQQPVMSAPSTTHRFKRDFSKHKAILEVNGQTKAITADNLTDDDVPVLRRHGYGHFLEELPKPEPAKPAAKAPKSEKEDDKPKD